jgi:ferrous iron transport protein A
MTKSLRHMQINERAVIKTVSATRELGRRLRDMGLVPGTEVLIVGRAPLQDPVSLRLKGFTMTLRNNEADYITVETED